LGQPDTHDLDAGGRDPNEDRVEQIGPLAGERHADDSSDPT